MGKKRGGGDLAASWVFWIRLLAFAMQGLWFSVRGPKGPDLLVVLVGSGSLCLITRC